MSSCSIFNTCVHLLLSLDSSLYIGDQLLDIFVPETKNVLSNVSVYEV